MRLLTSALMFAFVLGFLSPSAALARPKDSMSNNFFNDDAQSELSIASVSVEEDEPAAPSVGWSKNLDDSGDFILLRDDEEPKPPTLDDHLNTAGHVIGVTKDLVALGKDVWDLFEKGKPVKSVELNPINILPRSTGELEWIPLYEMYGWSMPTVKTYKVVFKNYLNMDVCVFRFSIEYQYNGRTEEKDGRYLAAINIVPNSVSLKWGFNLDARAKFIGATNMSNVPRVVLAAGRFQVDYSVSSLLSTEAQSISFFVLADGRLQMLSN